MSAQLPDGGEIMGEILSNSCICNKIVLFFVPALRLSLLLEMATLLHAASMRAGLQSSGRTTAARVVFGSRKCSLAPTRLSNLSALGSKIPQPTLPARVARQQQRSSPVRPFAAADGAAGLIFIDKPLGQRARIAGWENVLIDSPPTCCCPFSQCPPPRRRKNLQD